MNVRRCAGVSGSSALRHACAPGGTSGVAELVVEVLQDLAVAPFGGPHHPAALVMIGDYSEEPVAFAIRHLIDADPQQPVEPLAVSAVPRRPAAR